MIKSFKWNKAPYQKHSNIVSFFSPVLDEADSPTPEDFGDFDQPTGQPCKKIVRRTQSVPTDRSVDKVVVVEFSVKNFKKMREHLERPPFFWDPPIG